MKQFTLFFKIQYNQFKFGKETEESWGLKASLKTLEWDRRLFALCLDCDDGGLIQLNVSEFFFLKITTQIANNSMFFNRHHKI
jgi:hypothetical protein